MAFRVEISPEAFWDLDRISAYIRENGNGATVERWFNGIFAAIRSLAEMADRCAIAEESVDLKAEVRVLLHGKRKRCYKVYYAVDQATETVRVFHVRHWARKPVEVDELGDLMEEAMDLEDDDN
jgi:plasmid stabilization system protein ParE